MHFSCKNFCIKFSYVLFLETIYLSYSFVRWGKIFWFHLQRRIFQHKHTHTQKKKFCLILRSYKREYNICIITHEKSLKSLKLNPFSYHCCDKSTYTFSCMYLYVKKKTNKVKNWIRTWKIKLFIYFLCVHVISWNI